jgi:hypothetical protein
MDHQETVDHLQAYRRLRHHFSTQMNPVSLEATKLFCQVSQIAFMCLCNASHRSFHRLLLCGSALTFHRPLNTLARMSHAPHRCPAGCLTFWKHEPPKPTLLCKNLGPILLSFPIAYATSDTFAPVACKQQTYRTPFNILSIGLLTCRQGTAPIHLRIHHDQEIELSFVCPKCTALPRTNRKC